MDIQLPTDSCYPVFQPLVQLATGITAGYEALLRSQASESPQSLFQAARSLGVPIGQGFLLGRPDVLRNQAGRFTAYG